MRRLAPFFLVGLSLIGSPGLLLGQRLYRIEAGAAGSYNSYDNATELGGTVGGTARLGYWFWRFASVEVEGSFSSPQAKNGQTVNVMSLVGSGLYNLPLGLYNSAYLRGGLGRIGYGDCPDSIAPATICGSATALLGGVGGRFALSPTMMLRAEVLLSRSSSPSFSNFSVSAGVSWMLGSQRLADTDEDLVFDRYDRCAETPLGAIVNRNGCPSDTDGDTVLDGLDRCPNSPQGSRVDTAGCPRDGDRDGVIDGLDRCEETPSGALVDATGCPSDNDGDRILEGLDRCPNTPTGATVDRLGCPGDQDNDRVFDGIDRCPDTPPGTVVNSFGCAPTTPVRDADRDGVSDAADRCPNTPAGTQVDANGCPLAGDADRDGTPDTGDLCPNTPPNTRVDTYGCPIAPAPGQVNPPPPAQAADTGQRLAPAQTLRGRWTVPGNAFAIRSAVLRSAVHPQLDSIAEVLRSEPQTRVEIGGNAHDRLPPTENLKLSTDRAQAIRLYLLQKGVAGSQLTIRGYGSSNLITQDSSDVARVLNRRIEIRVLATPGP
jgi:outer membrane protein OmpA-like peptidoglycan-associated protein